MRFPFFKTVVSRSSFQIQYFIIQPQNKTCGRDPDRRSDGWMDEGMREKRVIKPILMFALLLHTTSPEIRLPLLYA